MKKGVAVVGATSSIGRALAGELAQKGHPLYLASRDEEELQRIAADLIVRYKVSVKHGHFDADDFQSHLSFFQRMKAELKGEMEGIVVAFGDLGKQEEAAKDFSKAELIFKRNFLGVCSILTHCANDFEQKQSGFIVGFSSVAGDRGRQSNYVYGAAKGGMSVFLQGLRNRLYPFGVHVMTVKPGFVDTAMTFGRDKLFLVASPAYVAKKVIQSLEKKKDEVYVPWFWRHIMLIIRAVPEKLFKRLKL